MPLSDDPEFAKAFEPLMTVLASRPPLKVHDIETRRDNVTESYPRHENTLAIQPDVVQNHIAIQHSLT